MKLAPGTQDRDQGGGGSNPLSPTNLFNSLDGCGSLKDPEATFYGANCYAPSIWPAPTWVHE
jgi:hypothetical protein